ncbi:flagellar protein MotY [Neptunomonas phycophila]|jgi:outer membrane protein OmpA-like peptidoglycan-associated protein|uniref:flagellar protein MotY n=2 Tax=Neptunomonas TaxID=75687 RepID=UPI0015C00A1F|nr:OmpA family protein [Neptunomonas phycophila]QLE98296.1 OmpA family protein [Neptunomonas phycophila]
MIQIIRLTLVSWAVLSAPFAMAVTFMASIDQSVWDVETSKFYCRLSQEVPTFGRGSFFHEAGEKAVFELSPTQKGSFSGDVRLVAEASPWQPGLAPKYIAQLSVPAASSPDQIKPLMVSEQYAGEMLVSLFQGMSPTFTMSNWLGSGERARVALSAANFQKSYSDYMACVDELLPVNYRQVARTAVLYPPAQWRLSDASKDRLDLIIEYVKTDPKVKELYVDGHSDNAGRRLLNRDLSKQRAEDITRYLVANGISEEMITTRYHGERYPAVPNNSKANRARNRRATIRLERE